MRLRRRGARLGDRSRRHVVGRLPTVDSVGVVWGFLRVVTVISVPYPIVVGNVGAVSATPGPRLGRQHKGLSKSFDDFVVGFSIGS